MARPPTLEEFLLGGARSPEELFDLLDRASCLTPRGEARRAEAVATMQRVADAYEPPIQVGVPEPMPGSDHTCRSPSLWDAIEAELTADGLLDMRCFQVGTDVSNYYGPVDALVAEVRAIHDARRGTEPLTTRHWLFESVDVKIRARYGTVGPNALPCPHCRRPVPSGAYHCVRCGRQLRFICSCGRP